LYEYCAIAELLQIQYFTGKSVDRLDTLVIQYHCTIMYYTLGVVSNSIVHDRVNMFIRVMTTLAHTRIVWL